MEVADQHFEALGAQHLMNGFQGVDEQQVGQGRHQYHHRMALRRSQGTGRGVDHVVEFQRGFLDFFHQFSGHGADATQGAGGGDRADAGQSGNFVQGRAASGAGIFIVLGCVHRRLAKQNSRH
ncbi:hypothetical protein D9M73_154520 [compost metagenome]